MFEIILENIELIATVGVLLGGTVFGMWSWHKKEVEKAFADGKQEETCLQRIEGKADEAIEGVKRIEEKVDNEVEKASEHHLRLYDKIDRNDKTLAEIASDISFLKGKFSQ